MSLSTLRSILVRLMTACTLARLELGKLQAGCYLC